MKNDKLNLVIFLLSGIAIGLLIAFIFVLIFKGNDKEYETVYDNKPETVTEFNEPVEDYFSKVASSNDENKLKEGFTSIVDFLFYGKEINGITFNQLKDDSKTKILKFALSIDQKIEEKFLNNKDKLSSKYQNIKAKVVESYLDITDRICVNNEQLCIDFKKDFESLKENFGITYDYLKEYGIKGIDKIKEWYESFRE